MGHKAALLLACPLLFSCGLPGYDAAQGIECVRALSCPELTRGMVEFHRGFADGREASGLIEFDLEKRYLHSVYETSDGGSIEKWVYADDLGEGSKLIKAYRLKNYPFREESVDLGTASGDIAFLSDYAARPGGAPEHVLVINYAGLGGEKLGEAVEAIEGIIN